MNHGYNLTQVPQNPVVQLPFVGTYTYKVRHAASVSDEDASRNGERADVDRVKPHFNVIQVTHSG